VSYVLSQHNGNYLNFWDNISIYIIYPCVGEHDRSMARRNPETPLNPSSAWNWGLQFSPEYIKVRNFG